MARELQVAVPGWVLEFLDTWATVLSTTTHTSAKRIADALGIGKKGGATVTTQAAREVRDWEIVADVVHLKDHPRRQCKAAAKQLRVDADLIDPGDKFVDIMEHVAGEYDLDFNSVKAKYYRMVRPASQR